MILQIGADAGPIEQHVDAVCAQVFGRADAGQHQDLRRSDRARGEHDFATAARAAQYASLPPAHADGGAASENQAFDQAAGLEPQIGAVEHRLQESARRGYTPAAPLIDMKGAAAFVVAAVEI